MTTTVDVCSVCLEPMDKPDAVVTLQCTHAYHGECLVRAFRYSPRCPLCRDNPIAVVTIDTEHDNRWREYRELAHRRRTVMDRPELQALVLMKTRFDNERRVNRLRLRMINEHESRRKLRLRQQRLNSRYQWCENRIRAELLGHGIPLYLRRPIAR